MSLLIKALRQAERDHRRVREAGGEAATAPTSADAAARSAPRTEDPFDMLLSLDDVTHDAGLGIRAGDDETIVDAGQDLAIDDSTADGHMHLPDRSAQRPAVESADRPPGSSIDPVVQRAALPRGEATPAFDWQVLPEQLPPLPRHLPADRTPAIALADDPAHSVPTSVPAPAVSAPASGRATRADSTTLDDTPRARPLRLANRRDWQRMAIPGATGAIGLVIGIYLWMQFNDGGSTGIDEQPATAWQQSSSSVESTVVTSAAGSKTPAGSASGESEPATQVVNATSVDATGTQTTSTTTTGTQTTVASNETPVAGPNVPVEASGLETKGPTPASPKRSAKVSQRVSNGEPTNVAPNASQGAATIASPGATPRASRHSSSDADPKAAPRQSAGRPGMPPVRFTRNEDAVARKRALMNDGYQQLQQGNYSAAQTAYQSALGMDANLIDGWVGLAAASANLGQPALADQYYRRALNIDPNDPAARTGLIALQNGGSAGDNESALRSLQDSHGRTGAAQQSLGASLAAQGRWAEAQQAYFEANTLQPDDADIVFNLAVSLERIRQPRAAMEQYLRALDLAASHGARFDLATARARVEALRPRPAEAR